MLWPCWSLEGKKRISVYWIPNKRFDTDLLWFVIWINTQKERLPCLWIQGTFCWGRLLQQKKFAKAWHIKNTTDDSLRFGWQNFAKAWHIFAKAWHIKIAADNTLCLGWQSFAKVWYIKISTDDTLRLGPQNFQRQLGASRFYLCCASVDFFSEQSSLIKRYLGCWDTTATDQRPAPRLWHF